MSNVPKGGIVSTSLTFELIQDALASLWQFLVWYLADLSCEAYSFHHSLVVIVKLSGCVDLKWHLILLLKVTCFDFH